MQGMEIASNRNCKKWSWNGKCQEIWLAVATILIWDIIRCRLLNFISRIKSRRRFTNCTFLELDNKLNLATGATQVSRVSLQFEWLTTINMSAIEKLITILAYFVAVSKAQHRNLHLRDGLQPSRHAVRKPSTPPVEFWGETRQGVRDSFQTFFTAKTITI